MKPTTKKRRYYQAKPKPQLWPIDYNNGEIIKETVRLPSGKTLTVGLTYVHAHYLAWLNKTEGFDVHSFILNIIDTTDAENPNKTIQISIARLYIHREANNLKRPYWLASLYH